MIFLQEFVYENSQDNSFQNSENVLNKLIKTMPIWSLANSPVMRVIKIRILVKSNYSGKQSKGICLLLGFELRTAYFSKLKNVNFDQTRLKWSRFGPESSVTSNQILKIMSYR